MPLNPKSILRGFKSGETPGFDQTFMSKVRMSAIPSGGSFINLLTGFPGVVTSSGGFPKTSIQSGIGPTQLFDTSGTGVIKFAGMPTTADTQFTIAAIFVPTSAGLNASMLSNSDNGTGIYLRLNGASIIMQYAGIGGNSFNSSFAVNNPYFVAVSQTTTSIFNAVFVDLRTGSTVSTINGTGSTMVAPSGTYSIGGFNGGNASGCYMGPVMYASACMELTELLQWADDPLSFWYPQDMFNTSVGQAAAVAAARYRMLMGMGT